MATVLSRRLGKRSLLGARISAPPLLGEGVLVPTQNHPLHPDHHDKGSPPLVSYEEHGDGPADQHQNWPALLPGQKVCVFCNGQEKTGLVEHHDRDSNEVKISLPEQGFSVCRKAEEVRLADVQTLPCLPLEMERSSGMTVGFDAIPVAMEDCPTTTADAVASALRSVSQNIDVPKRKSDAAVEMDEMMAAMVLTSLSCSPVVQSPPNSDASISAARMEVAKNWKTGKLSLADWWIRTQNNWLSEKLSFQMKINKGHKTRETFQEEWHIFIEYIHKQQGQLQPPRGQHFFWRDTIDILPFP